VRRLKQCERWRCVNRGRRSCVICMKKQNERPKRPEGQRRLGGRPRR
jgi:hypothetical protein